MYKYCLIKSKLYSCLNEFGFFFILKVDNIYVIDKSKFFCQNNNNRYCEFLKIINYGIIYVYK